MTPYILYIEDICGFWCEHAPTWKLTSNGLTLQLSWLPCDKSVTIMVLKVINLNLISHCLFQSP